MTEGRNAPSGDRSGVSQLPYSGGSGSDDWGVTTTTAAGPREDSPTQASTTIGDNAPPTPPAKGKAKKNAARQPRRARLTVSHVNVFTVFKFACVLSVALFCVWLIMIGILYGILDVAGVFDKVNSTVQSIQGDNTKNVVNGNVVFGAAMIIGAVNMVLFIALSTIGSMIYNLCADLVGGLELTLSERE